VAPSTTEPYSAHQTDSGAIGVQEETPNWQSYSVRGFISIVCLESRGQSSIWIDYCKTTIRWSRMSNWGIDLQVRAEAATRNCWRGLSLSAKLVEFAIRADILSEPQKPLECWTDGTTNSNGTDRALATCSLARPVTCNWQWAMCDLPQNPRAPDS
jgi:hypothetical protein